MEVEPRAIAARPERADELLTVCRFVGRVWDVVRVRGSLIYPKQVQRAIAKWLQTSRYQILITRLKHRGAMTLKIELADETINKGELFPNLD